MSKTLMKTLAATALLATTVVASATPITGKFDFSGLTGVLISNGNVDWNNGAGTPATTNPPPNYVNPTYGNFTVSTGLYSAAVAGSFAGLDTTTAQIHDMSSPQVINPPDMNAFAVGVNTLVTNFFKFNSAPASWHFDANFLAPGVSVGPIITPYQIGVGGNGGISVTIRVSGKAWVDMNGNSSFDEGIDDLSTWRAVLTTQYSEFTSFDQAVAYLNVNGSLPNASWSGNLIAEPLPEPSSIALVGLALAGVGAVARRRQRAK